jgi:hypothetical protein
MTWYTGTLAGGTGGNLLDRDVVLMTAADGTQVLVQNITPADAPAGTVPTINAFKLDGSPYTGAISDLTCCGDEETTKIVKTEYCANNLNYTRLDGVNIKTGLILWTKWLDDVGNVVENPSSPQHSTVGGWTGGVGQSLAFNNGFELKKGVCQVNLSKKLYLKENTGVLTLQDIILELPANSVIESISILQDVGVGLIIGDAGSSLTMQTGRVISYSVDDVGNFNTSNLTMDAGTITTATSTNDQIHSTVGGWTGGVGQPLTTNTVYSTQLGIQRITIIYSI